MDLRAKIEDTLRQAFAVDELVLDEDLAISGIVVSRDFQGKSALDRQKMLHHALWDAPADFTKAERRRIFVIAPLTPAEFAALGSWDEKKTTCK